MSWMILAVLPIVLGSFMFLDNGDDSYSIFKLKDCEPVPLNFSGLYYLLSIFDLFELLDSLKRPLLSFFKF